MLFKLLNLVAISTGIAKAEDKKALQDSCFSVAMQGGGAFGSYEAGSLWGIYNGLKQKGTPEKAAYDSVSGVSAGAINALAVAMFPKGQEEAMVNFLSDEWLNLTTPEVFVNWPIPYVEVRWKSGVYNDQPLIDTLTKLYKETGSTLHRKFTVGTVDFNSGTYRTFNETISDPIKAVVSSASIPLVFPHQTWPDPLDMVCMDGGTLWNLNIVSAINRCREFVDDDSKITLDILVIGWSSQVPSYPAANLTSGVNNYQRYLELKKWTKGHRDIYEFMKAYPKVNFRYLLHHSAGLNFAMMDFNGKDTWEGQEVGRKDGLNAVAKGEGYYFSKVMEYFESPKLQLEFADVTDYLDFCYDLPVDETFIN